MKPSNSLENMNILVIVNRNFHGLYTPIVDTLKSKGHRVELLELGEVSKFRYKNNIQRVGNFFFRTFLNRNLKQEWREATIERYLSKLAADHRDNLYDLVILNHPDTCNLKHLSILRTMCRSLTCHLWDSSGKEPNFFKHIDRFDSVISFDPEDVRLYGFMETTNYLDDDIQPLAAPETYEYDVFGVMSYDKKRYHFIEQFLDANPRLSCNILIYVQSEHRRKYVTHSRVKIIDKPLMGENLTNAIKNSKSILDVGHAKQNGLSFRVFETLGYQRKLITTNSVVKQYPFFNQRNIYCIDSKNPFVDLDFFRSDYEPIDSSIVDRYRLRNWVDDYIKKLSSGLENQN